MGYVQRVGHVAVVAVVVAAAACGSGDNDTGDDAASRACDGLDAVNEATKTGDEEGIRDGFEDLNTAADESSDGQLTSLVADLRDADGNAEFALALVDLAEYCDQLGE